MTFFQARAISQTDFLHVRRDGWAADQWFIIWRGVWFAFSAGVVRVVQAADYDSDDLLATDWTTVPASLTSCPVVVGTPGSPGGAPPGPSFPGFPAEPSGPPYGGPDGSGGGGGGGGSGGSGGMPPAELGGFSVTFDGLVETNPHGLPKEISDTASTLNGDPIRLTRASSTTWKGYKSAGTYGPGPGGYNLPILWGVTVECPQYGDPNEVPYVFSVSLFWKNSFGGLSSIGGFHTTVPGKVGDAIDNDIASGTLGVGGGTATLSNG